MKIEINTKNLFLLIFALFISLLAFLATRANAGIIKIVNGYLNNYSILSKEKKDEYT
jgi:hypothetical protein